MSVLLIPDAWQGMASRQVLTLREPIQNPPDRSDVEEADGPVHHGIEQLVVQVTLVSACVHMGGLFTADEGLDATHTAARY
jgi:hypothetical protein